MAPGDRQPVSGTQRPVDARVTTAAAKRLVELSDVLWPYRVGIGEVVERSGEALTFIDA